MIKTDLPTARDISMAFEAMPKDSPLCPDCYHLLQETDDGMSYCPNEMCLNDEQYNLKVV